MKGLIHKNKKVIPLIIVFFIGTVLLYQQYDYNHLKKESNIATESVYVWDSRLEIPFSDEDTLKLYNEYDAENVTKFVQSYDNGEQSFLSVESNFIDNGVPSYDDNYFPWFPQNVTLLHGDVWQLGSEENVAVIDESTATYQFGKVNAVGEILEFQGVNWEVIGVVTDTTAVASNLDELIPYLVAQLDARPVTYVYVPYFHRNSIAFEYQKDSPDAYIINTHKPITKLEDAEYALFILNGDEDNISLLNDGSEVTSIGVMSADGFLTHNMRDSDPIFVILIDIIVLLLLYVLIKFLKRDIIITRKYSEQGKEGVLELRINQNQMDYVNKPVDILFKHNNEDSDTDLYTIFNLKKVIGICLVRINKEVPNVLIWHLLIDKDYQKQGYGKQAIKHIINEIETTYNCAIIVTTKAANKDAFHFFEKSGFTPISEEVDEVNLEYKLKIK